MLENQEVSDSWNHLSSLLQLLASLGVVAGVTSALVGLFLWAMKLIPRRQGHLDLLGTTGSCFAVATLGGIVGVLAGNSRTPAVHDLLPPLFSVLGTLVAIASLKEPSLWCKAAALALCLSLGTLAGARTGSQLRFAYYNSDSALKQRANVVALCKVQELRARQMAAALTEGQVDIGINLDCDKYPRE
jgi:hypothetical protein